MSEMCFIDFMISWLIGAVLGILVAHIIFRK